MGKQISEEKVKEILRLRREGKSVTEIGQILGCHRQTVRAYLRERQGSILVDEIKKEVLKEVLLEHFKELTNFAPSELASRFKYSYAERSSSTIGLLGLPGAGWPLYMAKEQERIYDPSPRVRHLTEALKEHTGESPLWSYWDEWEFIVGVYKGISTDFRDELNRKTEAPEIFLAVRREDLNKIQKWLLGNVLRLASGEPYTGLNIEKTKGHAELRCNYSGVAVAKVENAEDGKALYEHLISILKEVQEWKLLDELQKATKELKEAQEKLQGISVKIISELEVLGMKHAFPGSCHLCPI